MIWFRRILWFKNNYIQQENMYKLVLCSITISVVSALQEIHLSPPALLLLYRVNGMDPIKNYQKTMCKENINKLTAAKVISDSKIIRCFLEVIKSQSTLQTRLESLTTAWRYQESRYRGSNASSDLSLSNGSKPKAV